MSAGLAVVPPEAPAEEPGSGRPAPMPLLVSVATAAELLAVAPRTVYELAAAGVDRGGLPSVRIGRRVLIPRAALEEFIASRMQSGGRP